MPNVLDHEDIELEMPCFNKKCYSLGDQCPTCHGTYRTTTAFGDAILEFVKRHLDAAEGKAK